MSMMTRRHFAAGLASIAGTAALSRFARADTAAIEAAARKEGTLTWYIAQVDTETAERMGRAFTSDLSRHQGRGDPHDRSGGL